MGGDLLSSVFCLLSSVFCLLSSVCRRLSRMPGAAASAAHVTTLDLIVLVLYFAGTMGVGFAGTRRSRSVSGFTAADRNLPGWLTSLSILGTFVSSITFLALPAKAYASDWNPFVFSLALPFATWAALKWFLPFYRRSRYVSAYEHLKDRFGLWARTYEAHPGGLPPIYRGPERADFVFPWFIVSALPPGVTGLLIAAIFAAAMSTVSTSLNSSATIVLSDYYRRFISPRATERQAMWLLRTSRSCGAPRAPARRSR
jgi:Na+/proline symporter